MEGTGQFLSLCENVVDWLPATIARGDARQLKTLSMYPFLFTENNLSNGKRKSNCYVFPVTQGSEAHVGGWQCIKTICKKLELQNEKKRSQQESNDTEFQQFLCLSICPDAKEKNF